MKNGNWEEKSGRQFQNLLLMGLDAQGSLIFEGGNNGGGKKKAV